MILVGREGERGANGPSIRNPRAKQGDGAQVEEEIEHGQRPTTVDEPLADMAVEGSQQVPRSKESADEPRRVLSISLRWWRMELWHIWREGFCSSGFCKPASRGRVSLADSR